MRRILTVVFALIFVALSFATVSASLDRNILSAGNLFADRWFVATLCDAYCGFVIFFCWVAYKETSALARGGWFVAIMLLGNFATATYVLLQLYRMGPKWSAETLLLRNQEVATIIR